MEILDEMFRSFDNLCRKYGIQKIEVGPAHPDRRQNIHGCGRPQVHRVQAREALQEKALHGAHLGAGPRDAPGLARLHVQARQEPEGQDRHTLRQLHLRRPRLPQAAVLAHRRHHQHHLEVPPAHQGLHHGQSGQDNPQQRGPREVRGGRPIPARQVPPQEARLLRGTPG